MTDTPRTDAATNLALTGSWVRAEHARILERELLAANARVRVLTDHTLLALAALKAVRQSPEASAHINAPMFDGLIALIDKDLTERKAVLEAMINKAGA